VLPYWALWWLIGGDCHKILLSQTLLDMLQDVYNICKEDWMLYCICIAVCISAKWWAGADGKAPTYISANVFRCNGKLGYVEVIWTFA
jgi:hypothetical protein